MAVDVRQSAIDTVVAKGQFFMIDPQQMENRGMQVVGSRGILDGLPGPFVALPMGHATFDTGATEPRDKGAPVVVAA